MSKPNRTIQDIYNSINEPVKLVSYDPAWIVLFEAESTELKTLFDPHRLVAIEHYGSTSIPGLCAKPIVDVMIGLHEFFISEKEKAAFQALGYEYIGKARSYERFFLKKRGPLNFNLALVLHAGSVWYDNLMLRDYLRAHPEQARAYASLKQQAINEGCTRTIAYGDYKRNFIEALKEDARATLLPIDNKANVG